MRWTLRRPAARGRRPGEFAILPLPLCHEGHRDVTAAGPVSRTLPRLGDVDEIEAARRLLRGARRVLVVTGAGVSTESGIPDFRGPQGVWRTRDPSLWTIDRYLADPAVRRERWLERLSAPVEAAQPGAAHRALARLERSGRLLLLVTQNIDGLHHMAGSERVVEIHGTTRQAVCLTCGRRLPVATVLDRVREGDDDPHCELCGGLLKTATISFGQALVEEDLERSFAAARACDLCLAVGSTLSVWPAAGVPAEAVRCGAPLVIVNDGETDLDRAASLRISGRAGAVLEGLVEGLVAVGA